MPDPNTITITDADGDTVTIAIPAGAVDVAGDIVEPPPDPDPELGPDPDPAAQTGAVFNWRPRVKDPDTGQTVELAKFPYRRTPIVLADGSSHPGYNDGDRDSYLRTQTHLDNPNGEHIGRVVLAGGYSDDIDAIVLDDNFSDHTKYWYDLSPYSGAGTEGNDIPVRDGVGGAAGPNQKVTLRLVHRPTGTVIDVRDYGALLTNPDVAVNVTDEISEPFVDHGRADPPGGAEHTVYQRVRLTLFYKGREGHNYYFDSMHGDYYWHVTVAK